MLNNDTIKDLVDFQEQCCFDDIEATMYEAYPLYSVVYNKPYKKFGIVISHENDGYSCGEAEESEVFRMSIQYSDGYVRGVEWWLNEDIRSSQFVDNDLNPYIETVKQCSSFFEAVQSLKEVEHDGESVLKEV